MPTRHNHKHLHDKQSHFLYMNTYSSTPHNTTRKTPHPSHPLHKHTTYFNTPRLKKTLSPRTAATQQTFPQTPHSHNNIHKNKHAPYTRFYCPPHSLHHCPIQNKQITLSQIILTQTLRRITSMPLCPLCNITHTTPIIF